MSSIVLGVFRVTVGLLFDKGRDEAAKDGDVTDQKFRGLIVREIDDIKSKLDGLSRNWKRVSASLRKESSCCMKCLVRRGPGEEHGAAATRAACDGRRNEEIGAY